MFIGRTSWSTPKQEPKVELMRHNYRIEIPDNLARHSNFTPANAGTSHDKESKTPLLDLLALDKGQTKH
jgi:PhoPQ-activated pathogenicity-related protein